ncbi:MAG: type II toxin-antitoxin system PemK/MazF family toxin [Dictyoglomus sp.]
MKCEQILTISKERLIEKINSLEPQYIKKLKQLLDLS